MTGAAVEGADIAEQAVRWAPGLGAGVVGTVTLLIAALVVFDLSLDRVSVDGLADDGEVERSGGGGTAGEAEDDADDDDPDDGSEDSAAPRRLASTMHVLVAGSDDRSVLTPEERTELSTGDALGERTEALALVRVDPDSDRIDVLRLPRDLLVTRCDGSRGRINAAYAIGERDGTGGATCLVETITGWTGIPIHHVAKIDFRGFVDVVDAVGGVEIEVDEPLHDERAGLDLQPGCVRLDGAEALAFVRARHLDDDFGRIGRQQELVAATLDQVLTTSTIRDPWRLGQLLTTAQRSLQLDEGLTPQRMRALASTVARLGGDDVVTRTVDGDVGLSDAGVAFLYHDERYAEILFDAFVAGELSSTPVDAAAAQARTDGGSASRDGARSDLRAEPESAGPELRSRSRTADEGGASSGDETFAGC